MYFLMAEAGLGVLRERLSVGAFCSLDYDNTSFRLSGKLDFSPTGVTGGANYLRGVVALYIAITKSILTIFQTDYVMSSLSNQCVQPDAI